MNIKPIEPATDMAYNFTKVAVTAHYDVKVDPAQRYGYFEHHTLGDLQGGGLWFEQLPDDRLDLVDYDGVLKLPSEVIAALRDLGHQVDDIFI